LLLAVGLHAPLQLEVPEVPEHSYSAGRALSSPYPYQAALWHRSWSQPEMVIKHMRRMQIHVTHFREAALVKDVASHFSPHHRLDFMILEVFSSLNDSMIWLWLLMNHPCNPWAFPTFL